MANTASAEWRAAPMLPIAAALGYAMSVIHIYGLAPYVPEISKEFGWDRGQVTIGLSVATLIQAAMGVPIGILVDRIGPRLLALIGLFTAAAAFTFLGTAANSGDNWTVLGVSANVEWVMLWTIMSVAVLPIQATIWTSAVVSRFQVSRGLALAVTLCGASVAQMIFPRLGFTLIQNYGWRQAMMVEALIWLALALLPIFFWFRSARDVGVSELAQATAIDDGHEGMSFRQGLGSTVYLRLLLASLLLTFAMVGLSFHFMLILQAGGMEAGKAANVAGLIGFFSLIGRLATGVLLDRVRASFVGAGAFVLPMLAALLLIFVGSQGNAAYLAAALIGLTLGSEVDVLVYLVTRHFGLKSFGALYGGLLVALSLGTAFGPQTASEIFDSTGGYDLFLWTVAGFMAISSVALVSLPTPAFGIRRD